MGTHPLHYTMMISWQLNLHTIKHIMQAESAQCIDSYEAAYHNKHFIKCDFRSTILINYRCLTGEI